MCESKLFEDCQVLNFWENYEKSRISQIEDAKTNFTNTERRKVKHTIHQIRKNQVDKIFKSGTRR